MVFINIFHFINIYKNNIRLILELTKSYFTWIIFYSIHRNKKSNSILLPHLYWELNIYIFINNNCFANSKLNKKIKSIYALYRFISGQYMLFICPFIEINCVKARLLNLKKSLIIKICSRLYKMYTVQARKFGIFLYFYIFYFYVHIRLIFFIIIIQSCYYNSNNKKYKNIKIFRICAVGR